MVSLHDEKVVAIASPLPLPPSPPSPFSHTQSDLKLPDLDGFDWGDRENYEKEYMRKRSNYTYYKSILRLAMQYAGEATSVFDVLAIGPLAVCSCV